MRILFIGDINGKIGRQALQKIMPTLRAQHKPDIVIANIENAAHGRGITSKTLDEILAAGVAFGTSGNHILKKPEARELLVAEDPKIIRPANFPPDAPGTGWRRIATPKGDLLVINLIGRVFLKEAENYSNPFTELDKILQLQDSAPAATLVDFHAEATSEKAAFGLYADGRVSAVLGTHTHIPTADCRVLPKGTAFVTDVGMAGALNSVIGVDSGSVIESFRAGLDVTPADLPEHGPAVVNAVLIEIDTATGLAKSITRLDSQVTV